MKYIKLFEELKSNINYTTKPGSWEEVEDTEWNSEFEKLEVLPAWQVWAINPKVKAAYKNIWTLDYFEVKPSNEEFIVVLGPNYYLINAASYNYARNITHLINVPQDLKTN
jgi:hypothetical protein